MVSVFTKSGRDKTLSKLNFGLIGDIDLKNPKTFINKVFVSIDMDWAPDFAIEETLQILRKYPSSASTWFVTHATDMLPAMREFPNLELGIHPNFNPLLEGGGVSSSAHEILLEALKIVPEAKSLRSHSVLTGSRLRSIWQKVGILAHSNTYLPYDETDGRLNPFMDKAGMIEVPYGWEDDVDIQSTNVEVMNRILGQGFCVLDFHPIHIYLNSPNMDAYEATRDFHGDRASLEPHRYRGHGTRTIFEYVLSQSEKSEAIEPRK